MKVSKSAVAILMVAMAALPVGTAGAQVLQGVAFEVVPSSAPTAASVAYPAVVTRLPASDATALAVPGALIAVGLLGMALSVRTRRT
ncbi:MAG: hypothetical protein AAF677_09100 [Pseudomonadota bacterium]